MFHHDDNVPRTGISDKVRKLMEALDCHFGADSDSEHIQVSDANHILRIKMDVPAFTAEETVAFLHALDDAGLAEKLRPIHSDGYVMKADGERVDVTAGEHRPVELARNIRVIADPADVERFGNPPACIEIDLTRHMDAAHKLDEAIKNATRGKPLNQGGRGDTLQALRNEVLEKSPAARR